MGTVLGAAACSSAPKSVSGLTTYKDTGDAVANLLTATLERSPSGCLVVVAQPGSEEKVIAAFIEGSSLDGGVVSTPEGNATIGQGIRFSGIQGTKDDSELAVDPACANISTKVQRIRL